MQRERDGETDSDGERGGIIERTVRVEPNMDDIPRQAWPSLNITDTGKKEGDTRRLSGTQ